MDKPRLADAWIFLDSDDSTVTRSHSPLKGH
jgi:hypothetical protein